MQLLRRRVITTATQKTPITQVISAKRRAPMAGSASDNYAQKEKAKAEIERQLKLISNAYIEIDAAQLVASQAFKVIEAQLRLVNLKEHSDGVYKAALEEIWSRQSRVIDPKKFKARVTNDVFWASIKVSLDKAQEHLSEKEVNAICDVEPSKMKGIQLKVEKIQKVKTRTRA